MVSVAQKFSAYIELIVNRQNLKTRELNFVIQFWPDLANNSSTVPIYSTDSLVPQLD